MNCVIAKHACVALPPANARRHVTAQCMTWSAYGSSSSSERDDPTDDDDCCGERVGWWPSPPGWAGGGCGGTRKGLPAPARPSSSVTVQLSGFKSHCLTVLPGRNTTLPPSSIARSSVVSVFETSTAVTVPRPCIDPAASHTRIHSRARCRRRAAPSVLNPENLVQAGRAVMSESSR